MKALTIGVCNSNNYVGNSIFSGKIEAIEYDNGVMGIDVYKVIFEWIRYPNRYIHIDLRIYIFSL
jgi:hypothetical protein